MAEDFRGSCLNEACARINSKVIVVTAAEGCEARRLWIHMSSRPTDPGRYRVSQYTLCQRSRQPYVCLYGRVVLYVVLAAA